MFPPNFWPTSSPLMRGNARMHRRNTHSEGQQTRTIPSARASLQYPSIPLRPNILSTRIQGAIKQWTYSGVVGKEYASKANEYRCARVSKGR